MVYLNESITDIDHARSLLGDLEGNVCIKWFNSIGSVIFVDFDPRLLNEDQSPNRITYLMIEMSPWTLHSESRRLCTSDSDRNRIQRIISRLNGKRITNFFLLDDGSLRIRFDNGYRLATRRSDYIEVDPCDGMTLADYDEWTFEVASTCSVNMRSDGVFTLTV